MIYLLRHGETSWNRQGRKQGRGDSPLTDRGVAQAEQIAKKLQSLIANRDSLDIVASPMGRTQHTARLIAQNLGVEAERIQLETQLSEHDYGDWEGLTNSEIARYFPCELEKREKDKWHYRVPGGESYQLVDQRVREWLALHQTDKLCILVSHDMVSRVMRGIYLGLSEPDTLKLEHPQDQFFALENGRVETWRI